MTNRDHDPSREASPHEDDNRRRVIQRAEHRFPNVDEVVRASELTRQERIQVLEGWKYDALELQVAEEENMGPGESHLDEIQRALDMLRGQEDRADRTPVPTPTKHGQL